MLDPWIIEEIRRREEDRRREQRHELPLEDTQYQDRGQPLPPKSEDADRGVIVIDM